MWRINRILMKEAEAEKQSRIWETMNLSTDADSRTDTILEKLHYYCRTPDQTKIKIKSNQKSGKAL